MAFVKNNVVKMEWEQNGWLARRYRNSMTSAFIFASTIYPSKTKRKVTVFFTAETAFIWATNPHSSKEELWKAKSLKDWYKQGNADVTFPMNWEEYVAVIDSGNDSCNEDILREYGIENYKIDIENRLRDVAPFGEETDKPLY